VQAHPWERIDPELTVTISIGVAAGVAAEIDELLLEADALLYRATTRLDDSLDVLAAHGAGGIVGALLTGVFASKAWNAGGADGLLYGNARQLGVQAIAVLATLAYSTVATFVIVKCIALVTKLRTGPREEGMGMDFTQHGEEAYSRGEGALLLLERRKGS